ncbi:tape measure protein [uncultured Capnocytophaga sp.]|uniref:tape measure protein n=1 Tax=uncultured Capnocytophaga sp. TaxID=159273 RepID=UPI0028E7B36F|nr:tape measure protein [uncultured Capnocytophaga sp.]
MNNNNGSIDFEAHLRLEKLEEGVKEMEKMLNDSMKSSQKETDKLQQSINNLAKGAMAFFTLSQAKAFVSQVIEVRSQFQQLEISFGTMLKSKEKANALMAQMADLASKTPFGLEEVSEGAKRLLAFQVPAQEVTETLRRMGDVAAGLGVPMGQLIHVYGQVKAQGKLMTNDLYQFMNAGIPIIAELSKVVGKSETEIKDMVSAGKIGFPEVQAVIKNMTNEGGLFFNLMAEQSKSLGGQISNLGDSFDQMLNEIGKASEGYISGAIQGVSFLVENYQTLGKVIAGLIATYGTYRTAVLVNIALTKGWSIATKEDAIAKGIQTAATKAQTIATAALNTVMKANPYVLVASAVVALGFAMWALKDNTDANTRATERHNKLREEQANIIDKQKKNINDLISVVQDETKTWEQRNTAFLMLKSTMKGVFDQYTSLNDLLRNMAKALKDVNGEFAVMDESMSRDAVNKTEKGIKAKEAEIKRLEELQKKVDSTAALGIQRSIDNLKSQIKEDNILKGKQEKVVVGFDVNNFANSLNGMNASQLEETKQKIYEAFNRKKSVSTKNQWKFTDANNPFLNYSLEDLGRFNQAYKEHIKMIEQEKTKTTDVIALRKEILTLEKEIEAIEKRNKNSKSVSDKAQKELEEKRASLETKKKEYKGLTGDDLKAKSSSKSKSERPTFDQEAHLLQTTRLAIDNELAQQKANIEQMQEGYEKELALVRYYYDEKVEAIRRGGEDARIALEKERADSKGLMSDATYNAHLNAINENEIIANEQNSTLKIQQEQKLLDGLLEKYQTYTDQRKAIEEKYNADIAALQAKLGADAPQVKKAQDEKARELKKLDILYKKEGTAIAKLFDNLRKKTVKEIRQTITDAEAEIDALAKVLNMDDNANVEFITNLRQQLEQARDTADRGDTVFGRLGKNIQGLFKFKPNTIEWKEALQGVLSDAQSITGEFGQLGQEFEKLGQSTGNESLKRIGQTMQTVSNTLNRTLSMTQAGAQMGGGIGAAIGAVVGLITSGFEMYFKNELEAEKKRYEIAKSKIAQQNEYNRLLFEEKMLHKENISVFGKKELAIANDNLKEYINQRSELKKRMSENLYSNKAITVANGTYSTGWGIFEKEGTVWDNLIDVFPQLIDKAGEFDATVAKSIIDSKELYGDGKERLKGLIEQYERAQEAQKQFDEYVKNTFGELGTSVIDSVYNALQKGEDAFESFAKSVGNVIGKLGKQLAYELFIADHFKRLQEKITQAGKNNNGSEDFARQSSQIVSEFGNAMKSKVSEMETFLKQWNEMGKANGFEFLNEQNRQATEKGFARMSQDTGEELNGQFRLQTQLSAEIKNAALQTANFIREMNQFMQSNAAQQLRHLAGIEANTYKLHKIETDIANMKTGISEITTKGIKIRS